MPTGIFNDVKPKKVRYRNLTEEQKLVICNGCGPKGGWMPVPEFFCHASCNHHDFNYWIGGTEWDRLKADNQFYKEMRKDAGWNPWKLSVALTYYLAVRTCGFTCFHYGEERNSDDLDKIMEEATRIT
jgi:endogenous inhibitor of DNA gyrase (YacG/DUF329 family)